VRQLTPSLLFGGVVGTDIRGGTGKEEALIGGSHKKGKHQDKKKRTGSGAFPTKVFGRGKGDSEAWEGKINRNQSKGARRGLLITSRSRE